MTSPERFLSRFLDRSVQGEALDAILDEPDAFVEATRRLNGEFNAAWVLAADRTPPPRPIMAPEGLATAAIDSRGRIRAADDRFRAWFGAGGVDPAMARKALAGGGAVRTPISTVDGRESLVALGRGPLVSAWPLAAPVRAALMREPGLAAAVGVAVSGAEVLRAEAMRAFGLSPLEARVAAALAEHGKLPLASRRCGVGYEAAREALDRAMRKTGVRRQAELVGRLLALGLGAWHPPADMAAMLADAFDLTIRQARLAALVAEGAARADAARALGLSDAVAKDELSVVFETLNVPSAPALSRVVTETAALAVLTGVTGAALIEPSDRAEPLRLVPRPAGGGWIAVSDYGPEDGEPVFILHATATSRHAARSFVAALQAAGYRPLAVDRPGFGLTHPAPGADVFEAAALDMLAVCEAFHLGPVRIVARGGLRCAWRFQLLAPDRLARVVALNGNIAAVPARRSSLLSGFAAMLTRDPATTAAIARLFAGQAHTRAVERLLHRSIAASPADVAVFRARAEVDDYLRSCRFLASGQFEGVIAEQVALSRPAPLPPLPDSDRWTLVACANDPLFDAGAILEASLRLLPQARVVRLDDAGRFPHLSHPHEVIAALA
jgi:pimeloyl-ACP methyl ester carboxylesterase/DNA-binding CsgD family transcriptional regulator